MFSGHAERNIWIQRCAHTEIQIVGNIYVIYSGVTKLSHSGARIRKIRTPKNLVSKIRALQKSIPEN